MKIKQEYKVREIAGENVVIMQGRQGADLTQIVTLNASALVLWNALSGKEFTGAEAAEVLVQNFEVECMAECGLIEK